MVFTTSHKAKGLEWDAVVVHDDFAPFVDDLGDPVSFVHAEEINAWHVAVTRARRTLYVPPKLDALRAWCEQQDAAPGALENVTLQRPYGRVDRKRLKRRLVDACIKGDATLLTKRAVDVEGTAVEFDDGSSVRADWSRMMGTGFNGASNVAQGAGLACLSDAGLAAMDDLVGFYKENAAILKKTWEEMGYTVYGGTDAPYVWVSFDGRDRCELESGDSVFVRMSQYPIPTINYADQTGDFINSLRRCLRWNERDMQHAFDASQKEALRKISEAESNNK